MNPPCGADSNKCGKKKKRKHLHRATTDPTIVPGTNPIHSYGPSLFTPVYLVCEFAHGSHEEAHRRGFDGPSFT